MSGGYKIPVNHGREDFEKIMNLVRDNVSADPIYFKACGNFLDVNRPNVVWRDLMLHASGDCTGARSRFETVEQLVERAGEFPWSVGFFIFDGNRGNVNSAASFAIDIDLIQPQGNRIVFCLSAASFTGDIASELLELGVGVIYDNADIFPEDAPREIPTEYFASVPVSDDFTLTNRSPRRWRLGYNGPLTDPIDKSQIALARAYVGIAMDPIHIMTDNPLFNPTKQTKAFDDMVSTLTFGHDSAGSLAKGEDSKFLHQMPVLLVSSFDFSSLFDEAPILAEGYDLARRMNCVARIWAHFLAENCVRIDYSNDALGYGTGDARRYFYNKIENLASYIGVDSAIEAYYAGVPVDDILL